MNAQGGNVIKRDQKANRKFAQSVPPSPSSRLPSSAGGIPPSLLFRSRFPAFPPSCSRALTVSLSRSLVLAVSRSLAVSWVLSFFRKKKLDFAFSLC
jgi:hypothetical protein